MNLLSKMNTSQVFPTQAVKDKTLVCLVWLWYIYHWIKPSGKQIETKREHLRLFFFCIYSCPQVPTFLTERGHVCRPHLSPSLMTIFRLNPLVLGADIFQSSLWDPGAGASLRLRGVIVEMYFSSLSQLPNGRPQCDVVSWPRWMEEQVILSRGPYAGVLASRRDSKDLDKPLLAVAGPLGLRGYRAFYQGS